MKQKRQKKSNITTKLIIPKKLSKEAEKKKLAHEAVIRNRRDEDSVLIPDVSEYLESYKDDKKIQAEIKRCHDSSRAAETFNRLEQEAVRRQRRVNWGAEPMDDRETYIDDWWKTDKLISVAKKGIARDKKCSRNRKIKDFFHTVSARKFLNNHNRKKKEEKENKAIAQEFHDDFYLKDFRENKRVEMSEVLAEFLCFIYGRKGWRGIMTDDWAKKLAVTFIKQNNIKEVNPDIKMFVRFYVFWRDGEKT